MKKNKSVIGRFAMVKADNVICLANIIDKVAGTNLAKRVRLQSGEHVGEVRMHGQYDILEFVDCH
jgi:hypothetical protein